MTVELPEGWHMTTPDDGNVIDPVTRVVVASAAIRPHARGCQVSGYAFADDAVALVVVEWLEPSGRPGPRPRSFTHELLPVHAPPAIECFDGFGGTTQFIEGGRVFGAYILLGRAAAERRADEARAVLDTLTVDQR